MKITIFTEDFPQNKDRIAYPDGMNKCLCDFISKVHEVKMIIHTKNDDGSALSEEVLNDTDVLVWWGHSYHSEVSDEVVERVAGYVNRGMGLIVLHSGHKSKIFMRLLGTPADLCWHEENEKELLWTVDPSHPIAAGLKDRYIEIPEDETYGEPFGIPNPDELVFGFAADGKVHDPSVYMGAVANDFHSNPVICQCHVGQR